MESHKHKHVPFAHFAYAVSDTALAVSDPKVPKEPMRPTHRLFQCSEI